MASPRFCRQRGLRRTDLIAFGPSADQNHVDRRDVASAVALASAPEAQDWAALTRSPMLSRSSLLASPHRRALARPA